MLSGDPPSETVDLIYPVEPGGTGLQAYRSGSRSLISQTLGIRTPEQYSDAVSKHEPTTEKSSLDEHKGIEGAPYHVADAQISLTLDGEHDTLNCKRILSRVHLAGRPLNLVHSQLV